MNYARPCLGCFDDGAAEVIVDGRTGVLVRNALDQRELFEALERLLNDPERARAMGIEGFRRLQAEFTAQHVQRRIRACLEGVL